LGAEDVKAKTCRRLTVGLSELILAATACGGDHMASAVFLQSRAPASIPLREILPWAVFGGLLCLLALYFVGAEQGATSLFPGMYIHEFLHDGRHLLGFPCH
jgi:Probable cobalt transporter subunit (CbtB)